MNELKIFENPAFGKIRTVETDGEPWLVGKDVAEALGYSNTKDAIANHVDSEDKRIIQKSEFTTFENHIPKSALPVNFIPADVPNRGLTVINESGLYSLILSSKLPKAKEFKHWVTSEVLPTIRKHGMEELTFNYHDEAFTDSVRLAEGAGVAHASVIKLITTHIDDVEAFGKVGFQIRPLPDSKTGQKTKICRLNEEQATFVISMMKNTKNVVAFKKELVRQFYEMKRLISTMVEARQDFPLLTETIRQAHEAPKPYHYTNEMDMINRLVLGMSARQYREAHGIPKGENIRPHLTKEQLKQIDTLQKVDVGLVLVIPEFEKRKEELKKYLERRLRK